MIKITVDGRSGLTTRTIPFSTGKYPVWFDNDPKYPQFIEAYKIVFVDSVKEIAESYHDRTCLSGCSGGNFMCGCCGEKTTHTISIEHDSQDYSKDKSVCSDCYTEIHKYWKENNLQKTPIFK